MQDSGIKHGDLLEGHENNQMSSHTILSCHLVAGRPLARYGATLFWHAVGSQQNAFLTNKGAAFVRMRARSLDLRAAIPSDQQVTACKARAASRRVFILLPASCQVSSGKKRQPTIFLNIFLLRISILAIWPTVKGHD